MEKSQVSNILRSIDFLQIHNTIVRITQMNAFPVGSQFSWL